MKILFIILFLFFSSFAIAQDYNCHYVFDNEKFPLTLKKITNYSYSFNMNYETEEYILGETKQLLILGNPLRVDDSKLVFRVIFLDKQKKTFTITSIIEPNFSEDHAGGVWGYVMGTCD